MNALALAGLLAVQWAEPPYLAPGDRVRVHALGQPTYSGTLTSYVTGDRVALERDKFLGTYPSPATVTFDWFEVSRIDVPARGGNWLGGAVKGAGVAFLGAATTTVFCAAFGGLQPGAEGCPFWKDVGRFALVTVPVGAIIGSRFTRWKPVYKRKR